jgi:hypothetical protein
METVLAVAADPKTKLVNVEDDAWVIEGRYPGQRLLGQARAVD